MHKILAFLVPLLCAGCAPGAYTSNSALAGAGIGAGLGAAGGAIAHEMKPSLVPAKIMGAGAGLGAGLGILAGAAYYDSLYEEAQRQPPVRRAVVWDTTTARQIEDLRSELDQTTLEGRGENKAWSERYLDYSPSQPYQGPTLHPYKLEW